jgi:hypothetical protein
MDVLTEAVAVFFAFSALETVKHFDKVYYRIPPTRKLDICEVDA